MRNIITILIPLLLLISSHSAVASIQPNTNTQQSIFDVLNYQEVIEVELKTDLNKIINDRRTEEKIPAQFSFSDQEGIEQNWNIKVNLRGRFRRLKCEEMPPLKLNFKKGELKEQGLAKFDDMKLVTHCVTNEKEAKQLLLKEYLSYKLYNQISDESFRVQLLKIKYVDVNTYEEKKHWAILIEDTAQLRNRIGAKKIENSLNVPEENFYSTDISQVALFQYMIGNMDWEIAKARNIKILKRGEKNIAVPYDFDFSGIVNAPYRRINSDFQITKLDQRVYLGFEKDLENMEDVKALFLAKKKELIKTIKNFKYLNSESKRSMIRYINSFFKNIDHINPVPKPQIVGSMGE